MYYFPVSFPLRRSPNLFTWLLHSFLHSTFAEPCIGCVQITGHRPVSKTQIQSKFPILREHRGAGVTGLHTDGHNQVKTALEEAKDEILQGRTGVASTLDSGGQQRRVFRACLLLPSTCSGLNSQTKPSTPEDRICPFSFPFSLTPSSHRCLQK